MPINVRSTRRAAVVVLALFASMSVCEMGDAKGPLPLEVQITSEGKTVRVPPAFFVEEVNRAVSTDVLGVFTETDEQLSVDGEPLSVTLFIYTDRSGSGNVYRSLARGAVRRTYMDFDYHRTGRGAVGQVKADTQHGPGVGTWVRFSPAFVKLVDRALESGAGVRRVDKPAYESVGLDDEQTYVDYFVPAASVAVCGALLLLLWAVRQSRRIRATRSAIDDGTLSGSSLPTVR